MRRAIRVIVKASKAEEERLRKLREKIDREEKDEIIALGRLLKAQGRKPKPFYSRLNRSK